MKAAARKVAVNAAYDAWERAAREATTAKRDAAAAQTRLREANKAAQERHIEYRRILNTHEIARQAEEAQTA